MPGGCSSKYCRAPVSQAATAKEVPRQSSLFDGRIGPDSAGVRNPKFAIRNIRTLSDPSRPGANRGVAAAIGMQEGERVGGAGLAPDRHEDAAPSRERFENAAVVRLESDAAHRARQPQL